MQNTKNFFKVFGPGLLFASAAIGTSHLILSTQGGAHYGWQIGWVILIALVLKYPFFEFGARYAAATSNSLLVSYREQGLWAILLCLLIIGCGMFAVVGAVSGASAGLLVSFLGLDIDGPVVAAGLMLFTAALMIVGRYKLLDRFMKVLTGLLLIAIVIVFIAVLAKGPVAKVQGFVDPSMFDTAGLALLVALMGWMPTGLETSVFSSLWTVAKAESTGYDPSVEESRSEFNLGYLLAGVLAFLFLAIGTFSVFGTGERLEGNTVAFSNKLVSIFSSNLGQWSFPWMALLAFTAIYGTLTAAWDAFSRGIMKIVQILTRGHEEELSMGNKKFFEHYSFWVALTGLGGFLMLYQFSYSMILMLQVATSVSFLGAPIIAVLNLRAVMSLDEKYWPSKQWRFYCYVSIALMSFFTVYYIWALVTGVVGGH